MAASLRSWFSRHRTLVTRSGVLVLLVIVAVESFLLYLQWSARHEIATQSAKLLTAFLEGDTLKVPRTSGVPIRMRNVRFKWSDRVYVDATNLAVRAVPLQGTIVNLEDLDSFLLTMQRSEVSISPEVLEGMLNESVFNYPGSKLRDLKVELRDDEGERIVHLSGKIEVMFWLPFKMDAHLRVDTETNTLVVDAEHVKVLGVLSVTKLIKLEPLQLEHMISLPPNRSLMVADNLIMIKPFALFPPPRINGTMSRVTLDDRAIRLEFAGDAIAAPVSSARNYVYLKGGTTQFGSFRMLDTDILVVDQDPNDLFVFSLRHYADLIPRSSVALGDLRSAQVTMPDFEGVSPTLAAARERAEVDDDD